MKILTFFGRQPPPTPPVEPEKHYGLFPVSAGDVLISRPLFDVIVLRLEHGTPDERASLARSLRTVIGSLY